MNCSGLVISIMDINMCVKIKIANIIIYSLPANVDFDEFIVTKLGVETNFPKVQLSVIDINSLDLVLATFKLKS